MGSGILLTLIKNWKVIAVLMLVMALIGFGMHYQGLKSYSDALEEEVSDLEDKVIEKKATISSLKEAQKRTNEELTRYVKLYETILHRKNALQSRYNGLLKEVNEYVIPTNDKGLIDKPITIIPGGVPVEAMPGYKP